MKVTALARRHFHRNQRLLDVMKIEMPALSPTMTEGSIVKWHKKEGDSISPGDVLCDIQTDKAVISMDTEEEGIMAKIILPNDSKDIKIGQLIGLMVDVDDDWKNVQIPGESAAAAPNATAPSTAAPSVPTGEPFRGIRIEMPSLSPTMSEGTIVKWYKKEGDKVSPGDALCDIQTDKAVVSLDTEEEGIMAKILMPEGSKDVLIGKLIALIVEEGEDWENVTVPAEVETLLPAQPTPTPVAAAAAATAPTPIVKVIQPAAEVIEEIHSLIRVGPSVKKLLEEYSISPKEVPPTGSRGQLLKRDVLDAIKSKHLTKIDLSPLSPPAPVSVAAPPAAKAARPLPPPKPARLKFTDIPVTSMRKTIAKRLTESKTTIPHCYGSAECNVGNVTKLRKQLIADGVKVSINDFIIKAAALALERVPDINAIVEGGTAVKSSSVDISIAVATPNGLITPIVMDVLSLGVSNISQKVKELAGRAREGKLQLQEFQGGTFTISNLGMFGISEFSGVINPPQVGILSIGSSRLVPGVNGPMTLMTVTLSYDRSAVDEHAAARFLEAFREIIENPKLIISGDSPLTGPEIPAVEPAAPVAPTSTTPPGDMSSQPSAEALAREAFIKSLAS